MTAEGFWSIHVVPRGDARVLLNFSLLGRRIKAGRGRTPLLGPKRELGADYRPVAAMVTEAPPSLAFRR